ncbi:CBS domain-containing protein CBSX2, chloroplastic [Linum perenne]
MAASASSAASFATSLTNPPSPFLSLLPSSPAAAAAFSLNSSCRPPPLRRLRLSSCRQLPLVASASLTNSAPARNGTYKVGDFMTKKEELFVVEPSTSVDEALEVIVEKRVTGFPVIDDQWNLVILFCFCLFLLSSCSSLLQVGVVSDYDLLALDTISGANENDSNLFPDVDSTWKAFNEIQQLVGKTNGKVVGDLMTPNPLTVRENTNLEDAARLLLETKYRRLPVLDADGKLVGLITRGNVVRAALQIKRETAT